MPEDDRLIRTVTIDFIFKPWHEGQINLVIKALERESKRAFLRSDLGEAALFQAGETSHGYGGEYDDAK